MVPQREQKPLLFPRHNKIQPLSILLDTVSPAPYKFLPQVHHGQSLQCRASNPAILRENTMEDDVKLEVFCEYTHHHEPHCGDHNNKDQDKVKHFSFGLILFLLIFDPENHKFALQSSISGTVDHNLLQQS